MSEKPQDLKPRTKAFALRVIRMYSDLPKNDTVAQVLGKQVLRSGTSVGANYREARAQVQSANAIMLAIVSSAFPSSRLFTKIRVFFCPPDSFPLRISDAPALRASS